MSATRKNVVAMYRNMITLAKQLTPEKTKQQTLKTIRQEFRRQAPAAAGADDEKVVAELLAKAQSSLSYLKMVTPKSAVPNSRVDQLHKQTAPSPSPSGSSPSLSDVRVPGVVSNWSGRNMDPDSVQRHHRSLRRAGFKSNAHAIGHGGLF